MEISTIEDTLTCLERHGFTQISMEQGLLYNLKGNTGEGRLNFSGDINQCYMIECDILFTKEYMYDFHIPESYIELSTISSSQMSYSHINGNKTKISKGIGSHINIGEPGIICVPAGTRLTYTSFVIRENVISANQPSGEPKTNLFEPLNKVLINKHPPCHRQARILSDLIHCRMLGKIKSVYYHTKAIELLCLLLEILDKNRMKQPITNVQDKETVTKAQKLLACRLSTPLTTNELAKQVGVSTTKLKQIFKQETGRTIFDYLKDLRLGAALSLMTDSGATIASVANGIGYKSPSKFTAAFRDQYGVNPGKYLRMVRQRH